MRDFPGGPVVKTSPPVLGRGCGDGRGGVWVRALVRELGSHMPWGQKTKNIK